MLGNPPGPPQYVHTMQMGPVAPPFTSWMLPDPSNNNNQIRGIKMPGKQDGDFGTQLGDYYGSLSRPGFPRTGEWRCRVDGTLMCVELRLFVQSGGQNDGASTVGASMAPARKPKGQPSIVAVSQAASTHASLSVCSSWCAHSTHQVLNHACRLHVPTTLALPVPTTPTQAAT